MPTFNRTMHRTLWLYLADHSNCTKSRALENLGVPWYKRPKNSCYACECAISDNKDSCEVCPIDWGEYNGVRLFCMDKPSLYKQWTKATSDHKLLHDLAIKIADLPINPNFKGEVV